MKDIVSRFCVAVLLLATSVLSYASEGLASDQIVVKRLEENGDLTMTMSPNGCV